MTTLTMRDEKRLDVIQRVYRSELTVGQAALVLGVSERQCYRIKARVGKAGAKGVVHGNRGRPCKRKIKEKVVKRIVELAQGKYKDFNDHHLTEKLKNKNRSSSVVKRFAVFFEPTGSPPPRSAAGLNTEAAEKDGPVRG